MGTIPTKKLLNKWAQDDLPVEMAVGHLLQHLVLTEKSLKEARIAHRTSQTQVYQLSSELDAVKSELTQLQRDMAQVLGHLGLESKRPRGRPKKSGPPKKDS
ncbi:hypothetical protein QUF58_07480 [Anaerolineales bacterium HSG24]|nr:hypothetical protein [Anaerolineales bacterium HSG24]